MLWSRPSAWEGVWIPKHEEPYDGVPLVVPECLLTVLTIFICTSRLGAWQGWALLPRTIREIRGDPRSPGSTRQTRGIEPDLPLVS